MIEEGSRFLESGSENPLTAEAAFPTIPTHVAIIMDGNGRWAQERGRSRSEGHRAGTDNIRRVIQALVRYGVKYLTVFAFSTENWDRPGDEVQALVELLGEAIRAETQELHEQGVRIRHLGRADRLSPELRKAINSSIELTKDNTTLTLNVAFDYGGRAEILDAVRGMMADGLPPDQVSEEVFSSYMYTGDIPDPDLIVRTAGEMRLSNFLLWQAAYAEYYTTLKPWPDFDEEEVAKALDAYSRRHRRFGRVVAADLPAC